MNIYNICTILIGSFLSQVPFRLTRDIIDGMGITGVEGVFRKCCEETLSVMRANKEALLTIVEVTTSESLISVLNIEKHISRNA